MDKYLNSILTIILIAIYWFTSRAQNSKIKAQSDIINELKEYLNFFDLKKIKEYVELRESEKDKLMDLTRVTLEKEFEFKKDSKAQISGKELKTSVQELANKMKDMMTEPYIYIVGELFLKPDDELEKILNQDFPKNKNLILEMIHIAQREETKQAKASSVKRIK